jgi:hypothetical protein
VVSYRLDDVPIEVLSQTNQSTGMRRAQLTRPPRPRPRHFRLGRRRRCPRVRRRHS